MSWDAFIEGLRSFVVWVMDVSSVPILVYFVLINTSLLTLIVLAYLEFRAQQRRRASALSWQGAGLAPGVSLLVPAYNEEAGIVTAVKSFLTLRYPRHEVVVIDDGSTDATFARLEEAFDLVPVPRELPREIPVRARVLGVFVPRDGRTRLVVVRKENSGKTEALNLGINAASEPLVAMLDGDSILEPDGLLHVTRPFADDPTRMVATGGAIRPVNGSRVLSGRIVRVEMPQTWLPRIQLVEYLRAFLLGRTGWSRLGGLILISGAFGLFRRDVVVEVGGLDPGTIGEDFELVMRIHKRLRDEGRDYRIEFVPEPVSWTEVPVTARVLRNQRRRWQRGLWETLWAYRAMLFRPRYGRIGWVALPYYWLFELIAPLLELLGIIIVPLGLLLGVVDVPFAVLFLVLAYGYAVLVTLAAMVVDEWAFHKHDRWRAIWQTVASSVLENFGYRQATVWWRLEGMWASLRRKKHVWGVMTRTGFDEDPA
ncbi:glycosyltransferase family 2 protein [Terrabacter sp. MAHUQ-38]|uniref:glycosyltransferase family 2 protein n=1 Tax=unclassified Terrabacter TaxID=2630222 RepID=UPI00165E9B50|nr:glycosyltransferase [Terrabacter sp. MAHUQ-38]MBC9821659.1 glycosyltransferase family 2 protein [Terrabacter sp. MAHUQ-38]